MKVAIVIFVIGEKYVISFNTIFRTNIEQYCKKYNYDLIILDKLLKHEDDMNYKKFCWQRLLIPYNFKEYDFVVSFDSDIFVNPDAPPLPLYEIPAGKVGVVNERKYMENYEWRERIQIRNGYERTGREWYALSGETKNYDDHINGGLVIYQPKYHGDMFKSLYDNNIHNYMRFHQDDQSIISSYIIDNNMVHWLDQRYNRLWGYWRDIFYPNFRELDRNTQKIYLHNCIYLNYFTHFHGRENCDLIYG